MALALALAMALAMALALAPAMAMALALALALALAPAMAMALALALAMAPAMAPAMALALAPALAMALAMALALALAPAMAMAEWVRRKTAQIVNKRRSHNLPRSRSPLLEPLRKGSRPMVYVAQVSDQATYHLYSNRFYITAKDVSTETPSFRSVWKLVPQSPRDPATRIADIVTTVSSLSAIQKAVAEAMPGWIPVQRITGEGGVF